MSPTPLLLLGLTLLAAVQDRSQASPSDTRSTSDLERFVPRMREASAQLEHARRLKSRMVSQTRESRAFWRKLAVEAYQAVRAFHPEDVTVAVEASFRAGELLRSGGEPERALAEFTWAARARRGVFSTRARLEVGHLHRRSGRCRKALDTYLDVAADAAARASHRDDAWLWSGQIWKREGRLEEARTAWRRVAEHGEDPLDRIRAFDLLGELWLEKDDIEAACGVLNECLQALTQAALEETRKGERVRNGMLRMRLVDVLPRAIARRNGSSNEPVTSRNP